MSQLKLSLTSLFLLFAVSACVTINVYFPAAAAEKAADKLIQEVWEKKQEAEKQEQAPQENTEKPSESSSEETTQSQNQPSMSHILLANSLDWLIAPAHAEAADFNVSTPAIEALKERMKKRFEVLEAYYDNGAIGLSNDALIVLRKPSSIPLRQRNKIKTEVDDENQDRLALYQAIANANGHPEWFENIRATFAQRWISNAKKGWWYQNNKGQWVQKS